MTTITIYNIHSTGIYAMMDIVNETVTHTEHYYMLYVCYGVTTAWWNASQQKTNWCAQAKIANIA